MPERGLAYRLKAVNRAADAINCCRQQGAKRRFHAACAQDRAARFILLVRGLGRTLQYQLRHTTG
jgi:hypothetical protein